ncbi:MAG: hypothetical protein AB8F74_21125 [Saprospiraceae bacterium]
MNRFITHIVGVLLLTSIFACQSGEGNSSVEGDKVLAQVYNKMLYLSDMEGMFPENSSKEDSTMIVNSFIERWVRENVLMHEAERNIPQNLNIDDLVRDYRSSLIRHNFEKNMVDILLDSVVTEAEMMQHYEQNKEQFRLSATILRCRLVKFPKDLDQLSEVKKAWPGRTEEGFKNLLELSARHANVYMLEDSVWYKKDDIALRLPKGIISTGNLSEGKDITMEDDNFRYFFKVNEIIKGGKVAPMSYVKDQISKVILHDRKLKLLKSKTEEMYERELRKNNIKVFSQR